ncbi:hypothetical protein [Streptomyces alfalfae]|uniref:hypothetical protein n=1 Tax=Streptomyces alfalfae TaxID=1642299 RepID=UPI002812835A|nr:hypothetical protein [Streptomyces alfalfae]
MNRRKPIPATPEQRDAQRHVVAIIKANSVLNRGGLALWRPDSEDIYNTADADAVAAGLELLGVHSTIVTRYMPPQSYERRMRKGREVRVSWSELATLVNWMPSLKERMEGLPEDASTVFEFPFFEPRPEGMAVCQGAFASRWPWWTEKQARRMGLFCVDCDCDLRAEDRVAYLIANAEGRKRLHCGDCCNDGLDALEALTKGQRTGR